MTKQKARGDKPSKVPFEEAIKQLETIVQKLEEEEVPLESSLELFEDGVRLSRDCLQRLEAAERRIEVLMRDETTGEDRAIPFDSPEED